MWGGLSDRHDARPAIRHLADESDRGICADLLAAPVTAYIVLFDKVDALLAEGNHDARLASSTSTQPRIIGYGGTPFAIELGQDNNRVEGDVAENMNWLGWATMDQTLRVLTGTKTVATENTGLRFVDDDAWGAEGVGPGKLELPALARPGLGRPPRRRRLDHRLHQALGRPDQVGRLPVERRLVGR